MSQPLSDLAVNNEYIEKLIIGGVPNGFQAIALQQLNTSLNSNNNIITYITRDDKQLRLLEKSLKFYSPNLHVITYPAWDCLPYDRISPNPQVISQRITALDKISKWSDNKKGNLIIITTVNAFLQKIPSPKFTGKKSWSARTGNSIKEAELIEFLTENGFSRTGTVVDPGDFAIRGGIIDIFPANQAHPVRLDLFGDSLDSIRNFDPETQRSTTQLKEITLLAAGEITLNSETISQFRKNYSHIYGGVDLKDPLYETINAGRRFQGIEHWSSLFWKEMTSLFSYFEEIAAEHNFTIIDDDTIDVIKSRCEQIEEYYQARLDALTNKSFGALPYKPLPVNELYIEQDEIYNFLSQTKSIKFSQFIPVTTNTSRSIIEIINNEAGTYSLNGKIGKNFAAERANQEVNIFEALLQYIKELQKQNKIIAIACWSDGSRDRIAGVLKDHGWKNILNTNKWQEVQTSDYNNINLIILEIEKGFITDDLAIISEQDILGDRLIRKSKKTKKPVDFISELSTISEGDLVVHVDHGVGRFLDLNTIEVQGLPHDCLTISYHGGDKLYLPVENIELLSRYGSDDLNVKLDKLGGVAWQAKKAKLKERIRDIADQLLKTAAARELRKANIIAPQEGVYDEFCARFPFAETEDQLTTIESIITDLAKGRPMDRLVCGDVGFGKTEVALRTAFIVAMSGHQVAIIAPTTLLARQHYATFSERFKGLPIKIGQLSRMVSNSEASQTKKDLTDGKIDIIIGTHALLGKNIKFADLNLLIIDEEQHFGVTHKERLKEFKSDIHVLTLTATPIPRTLQLALSGVRELSLITTPPIDRLAIRTFISPFDPVTIREFLLRELYRGGQSFYVCQRVSDIAEIKEFLNEYVPEVKVGIAHGQMSNTALDDVMTAFYNRKYDLLLATTIIESGIDVPTANTMIVHRADMFGLAQLYQLRGRIGRSKSRAYALLTTHAKKPLTPAATKRLQVMQSLDSLGAGFNLASHDLDIRGSGNLLGDEQSGHIREVGFELYQAMLEETVAALKDGDSELTSDGKWSPQINIGTAVLIPENYIPDLQIRMGLYRRLGDITTNTEVEAFAAELIDRFGTLPQEVSNLMQIIKIKSLCQKANIASIDAGAKGTVFSFRNDYFANPIGLIAFINDNGSLAKLRPDHKLVIKNKQNSSEERLKNVMVIANKLFKISQDNIPQTISN